MTVTQELTSQGGSRGGTTTTPARRYEIAPWDLSDLLPDASDGTIAAAVARLEKAVDDFSGHREHLDPDMDPRDFLAALRDYEALLTQLRVLWGHASLRFSFNTQDPVILNSRNRLRHVVAQAENRFLFFTLWWKALPPDVAEKLMPDGETVRDLAWDPCRLADYRHHLQVLRRFSPYTLDERSEQIINVKNTNGVEAVLTLYSMLTNRYEFVITVDGETLRLTDGETRGYFFHPDPHVRDATYEEFFRVYAEDEAVLAQIYATRVRDWHNEYVELRGLPSPISMRNLSNDIPDAAVETHLDVVRENAAVFQEYFELKSRWLGTPRLRRNDLYAPLATSHQTIDYPDAVATVLDTFYGFHEQVGELAEKIFTSRHIDAEVRKGKRSGAFCSTVVPDVLPWVHVNYVGRVRDVATLAHELGHAVHSMLASVHSVFTQSSSLPLAETASVFSEMLITDRLLEAETDPLVRRDLLAAAMDDIYATVVRQAFFVRFELEAHQMVIANRSAEEIADLYLDSLRDQFGESVDLPEVFRYEWLAIPHFFQTPFYCYAYSFGQLLVLALYRRYQEEGDAFKGPYLELLAQGGSDRPADMLGRMGIDIADPAFWHGGFEVVRGMLDELKSLDKELAQRP